VEAARQQQRYDDAVLVGDRLDRYAVVEVTDPDRQIRARTLHQGGDRFDHLGEARIGAAVRSKHQRWGHNYQ
jgi:hypothetical protein